MKKTVLSLGTILALSSMSSANVMANNTFEEKIIYENIEEYKKKYGINNLDESYKDNIDASTKAITLLNNNINETKNSIALKEKQFKQIENELDIKSEEIKQNMEALSIEVNKFNVTLQNYQKNDTASTIMTYLDYLFGEENLIDGLTKAFTYKELTESTLEYITRLEDKYAKLKKDYKEMQDAYKDLKIQKGKLIYEQQELSKLEKQLKSHLATLEEKESVRLEMLFAKSEKERQISLTKALLDEKFKNLALNSNVEYDAEKGTLLGHPMYLKVDEENPVYFITPAKGRFTSGFGWRDIGDGLEFHNGIDIANPVGTPIYASAAGIVTYVGEMGSYGQLVKVKHNIEGTTYTTVYAHLSAYAVRLGDEVKKGELIALMGNTGRSTGPHLHFEVQLGTGHYKDNPLNPADWLNKKIPKKETKKD